MALYGPLLDRYGRDKGQYKHKEYHVTPEGGLLTGPQLVLAYAERGTNCHAIPRSSAAHRSCTAPAATCFASEAPIPWPEALSTPAAPELIGALSGLEIFDSSAPLYNGR